MLGGEGNDRVTTEGLSSRYLHAEGNAGDDLIQLDNTSIDRSVYLFLNDGQDVAAVDSLTTGRNFKVYGDSGDDTFAAGVLSVGRKLRLNLGSGNDNVLFSGETNVERSAKIRTGSGDDFVGVLPEQFDAEAIFQGRFVVASGVGDDVTALDSNVSLNASIRISGGAGSDAVEVADSIDARIRRAETSDVVDLSGLVDQVFGTLANSDVTLDFANLISATEISSTESILEFPEGSSPVAVDDSIQVITPGTQFFSGGSVSIESFDGSQDILSFVDTDEISSEFDSEIGLLTLEGTASGAAYQQALRTVQYQNTSNSPVVGIRQITFTLVANGSEFDASRPLLVVPVGDDPIVELSRESLFIDAGGAPIILDDQLELSDNDSDQLISAIVSVVSGFEAGIDQLTFNSQAGVLGTFDPSTGALTFFGAASVDDYELVLRTVALDFVGTPNESDRTIRFTVNDGELTGFDELELEINV